jgi:hypothetical protein
MFISCNRQSVGQKQPAVEEQNAGPARVGTTGTTAPAQPEAGTSSTATASDAAVERDPDAIKALEDMSNYLRTLKAIQVHATTSRDEVLDDGQNVTFSGTLDMIAERPNHLRAEVINDKQQRMYFDDGKTFSVWARRVNYYATIPAPPTLRELGRQTVRPIQPRASDGRPFYWGDSKTTGDIVGAIDLGAAQVDGTTCEHYAFRQKGADWQVWIQQGNYPLPRKLVITTTTDPARPRFTSVMTWNLAPSFDEAAFTFEPPKDAKENHVWPNARRVIRSRELIIMSRPMVARQELS